MESSVDTARRAPMRQHPSLGSAAGTSLLEVLLMVSLVGILAGVAVPVTTGTIDELRASGAARHLAARIAAVRVDAIRRSSTVGLRFERAGADYAFRPFLDGNGNGLRTAEMTSGMDHPLGPAQRLAFEYAGTAVGLLPGIPDLDGALGGSAVRLGAASILSISPDGSCTSGTLYVHGRTSQFAIRILGATGRVRLFRYDRGAGRWITR
jgi:type II secretory pathway pseudopilin PulG